MQYLYITFSTTSSIIFLGKAVSCSTRKASDREVAGWFPVFIKPKAKNANAIFKAIKGFVCFLPDQHRRYFFLRFSELTFRFELLIMAPGNDKARKVGDAVARKTLIEQKAAEVKAAADAAAVRGLPLEGL